MGKYIKKFETTTAYNAATLDLPNVSLVEENMNVYYNPYVPTFFCKLTLNDDSTVELEGSGELTSSMITNYKSTVISVEIGKLCTSIGNSTFNGCSNLTSIIIPDSVISIGTNVFYDCIGLTSINVNTGNTIYDSRNNCNAIIKTGDNKLVTGCKTTIIPDSVTSIGDSAFIRCSGLTSITIPDSVTSIGSCAFQSSGLTSCTIGNGVTSIYSGAFNGCTGLTSINIPDSVTSIWSSAFNGCTSLTSIVIPNSITSINAQVFYNCTGLTNVTIGNSVKSIGTKAFSGCTGLTSITSLATKAPSLENNTFLNVHTKGTLTVPSGSTGYDTWMSTNDYYLGKYRWTKVKQ